MPQYGHEQYKNWSNWRNIKKYILQNENKNRLTITSIG